MAIGYAIPNTAVTYYTQPALTPAAIYADPNGVTPLANPQYSDGFGHTIAYLAAGAYTITYSGRQIQTLTLPDQNVGSSGGGGGVTPFAGTPSGTQDGVNRVFTFSVPISPAQLAVWLNFPLIVNVGYTSSWASGTLTIVYTTAPQPAVGSVAADSLYVQGFY
jgi:hypothetical protein